MSLIRDAGLLWKLQRLSPSYNVLGKSSTTIKSLGLHARGLASVRAPASSTSVLARRELSVKDFRNHLTYNQLVRRLSNSRLVSEEQREKTKPIATPAPASAANTTTSKNASSTTSTSTETAEIPVTKPKKPLKEDIWTIPNILTLSRLAAAPVIGYLIVDGQPFWALSLVVYSGITDLLDGYIARRFKMQSVVGSVIDPLADKALMMTLATCLGVSGDIPMAMAVIILGRDILLGLSAFYYRYISLPPPITFKRYWDFSIPSAEVHPTTISKYNTFFQMVYLGSSLIYPVIAPSLQTAAADNLGLGLTAMGYLVATTTIWSGLSYVFSKSAVKIIKQR
ncbi:cardiolipin synthase [Sugiyamaella lignohabitans]|uniref:Cardiolipin synthase n=1 Tax=Sugiyamaella lignohabitans TaxID=796027 RepID=A0A161HH32_9ASCO|nr:cardiolipin synthase [Sugiyamaella lignohabitans]ANB11287.1 cardiolipin synthase [Sugiyamaella lignohabitans]